ncbi:SDR family oxidoreductase [Arenibaculum pallidiluteum]|uniref:SDR family oxidoreductase n=1 Tax=Arenibaculum pallidiluteum TaxID=2812559 RepID=UPI001A96306A|nr:SDR family oxidoreductase [Arenibaculum pallidiluteum]
MTKTWFITGASSGFGRILAEKALARGDRVAATLRNPDTLAPLAERHGDALLVRRLDVSDPQAVRRVLDECFARLGRIDVVVSNAGYGLFGAAEELDEAEIRRIVDTNLLGSIAVIRHSLPHLRAQGGGRILQVSSEGGQMAYPGFGLYHATKWGIEGFAEAVAQEVAPFGIRLTLVEPGPTRTNFGRGLAHSRTMPAYDGTPADIVRRGMADGSFAVVGDPVKMVDRMIEAADAGDPPRRLTLGGTAYASVRAALTERLAALEAQREVALSTDADPA